MFGPGKFGADVFNGVKGDDQGDQARHREKVKAYHFSREKKTEYQIQWPWPPDRAGEDGFFLLRISHNSLIKVGSFNVDRECPCTSAKDNSGLRASHRRSGYGACVNGDTLSFSFRLTPSPRARLHAEEGSRFAMVCDHVVGSYPERCLATRTPEGGCGG